MECRKTRPATSFFFTASPFREAWVTKQEYPLHLNTISPNGKRPLTIAIRAVSIKTKIVSLNCLLRRDFYDMTCQFSGGEYIDTDFHQIVTAEYLSVSL